MIIKSINLENFQCYHGKDNLFEFTEGLNVIIGDNATGKSKLYDAFTWALFDECFETESRKTKCTPEFKGRLVSDQAKHHTIEGESVKTEVVLTFYRKKNNGSEEEFIVKRSYQIKKKSNTNWEEPLNSKLEVFKRELPLNPRMITDDPQSFIYHKLLPLNIRPYTWFQGEQVDNLIDFENKKALSDAINILSDISKFDDYVQLATRLADEASKEYKKESKRLGSAQEDFNILDAKKDIETRKVSKLKEELSEAEKSIEYFDTRLQQLISQVDDAKEIGKHQGLIESLERQISQNEQKINTLQIKKNKSLFSEYWVLKNTNHIVSEFEQKFSEYEQKRMQKENEKTAAEDYEKKLEKAFKQRLPKGNPEPIYLKQMLNEERCLICDREAKKESDAWLKIKELLDQTKPEVFPKDTPIARYNFQLSFKSLYQNGNRLQNRIEIANDSIRAKSLEIQAFFDESKELKSKWNEANSLLQSIISNSSISADNSGNIVKDFTEFDKKKRESIERRASKIAQIRKSENDLQEIEKKLREVTRGKMPEYLEEKKAILADFQIVAKSTRDRVFHKLIKQLEEEANRHFVSMTSGNLGVKGRIKLIEKDGYFMPKNVDSFGTELPNINDSNIILIKIAVIIAIISAKKTSRAAELYTLITDAPSSKFTDNYTIGFCKTVGEVYTQSIIMSKDFYANEALRSRLFDEKEVPNLGSVYIIEPSVGEENRTDRNNLSTIIIKSK